MPKEIAGAGGKVLLVCSTGGHLTELIRIESMFGVNPDSLWVTFDTLQSRELLEGRRVHYLPYTGPRDLKGTLRAGPPLLQIIRRERPDAAISTGAAIAVAALPLAALNGVPSTYIESVCRLNGPSRTGELLQHVPGIDLRTQHERWSSSRWKPFQSVLTDYRSEAVMPGREARKVFVTLGTIRGYRFDSVVDAVLRSDVSGVDITWQLGDTTRSDSLPGQVFHQLPPREFAEAARNADVVITHAGAGTLLELLGMGVYPVVSARRASRGEHVDDHQTEMADLVNSLDLGIAVEAPDITADVIQRAAQRRVVDGLPRGSLEVVR